MNREIKFRGKRVDNGEWVYGFYVQWEDHCNELKHLIFVKSNEDKEFSHMEQYEVIPETVGQFIGVLDKNGKEMYEDDVMQIINGKCKVDMHYSTLYHIEKHKIEVIGNIHDNKELLND